MEVQERSGGAAVWRRCGTRRRREKDVRSGRKKPEPSSRMIEKVARRVKATTSTTRRKNDTQAPSEVGELENAAARGAGMLKKGRS